MTLNLETFRGLYLDSGDNSIVQIAHDGNLMTEKTTSFLHLDALTRSKSDMIANNVIRAQFLRAIATSMGMADGITVQDGKIHFPAETLRQLEEVLGKELKMSDFEVRNGVVTSGRPLTQRRINAITSAVAKHLQDTTKAAIPKVSDMQLKSIVKNMQDFGIQDDQARVQQYLNVVKNGVGVNSILIGVKSDTMVKMLDTLKDKKCNDDMVLRTFAHHVALGEEPTEELFNAVSGVLQNIIDDLNVNMNDKDVMTRFMFLQGVVCGGANIEDVKAYMAGKIDSSAIRIPSTAFTGLPGNEMKLSDAILAYYTDLARMQPAVTIKDADGKVLVDYDPVNDPKAGDEAHGKAKGQEVANALGNASDLVKSKVLMSMTQNAMDVLASYNKNFAGPKAEFPRGIHYDIQLEENGNITLNCHSTERTKNMTCSYAITYKPDGSCVEAAPFTIARR